MGPSSASLATGAAGAARVASLTGGRRGDEAAELSPAGLRDTKISGELRNFRFMVVVVGD